MRFLGFLCGFLVLNPLAYSAGNNFHNVSSRGSVEVPPSISIKSLTASEKKVYSQLKKAVLQRKTKEIKALLQKHAKLINVIDNPRQSTLLSIAITNSIYGNTPSSIKVIGTLIEGGANVNIKPSSGDTPLLIVTRSYWMLKSKDLEKNVFTKDALIEISKLLIKAGADPKIKNKHGTSALSLAISENLLELVSLFTSYKG